jgi:hypothetical protein
MKTYLIIWHYRRCQRAFVRRLHQNGVWQWVHIWMILAEYTNQVRETR